MSSLQPLNSATPSGAQNSPARSPRMWMTLLFLIILQLPFPGLIPGDSLGVMAMQEGLLWLAAAAIVVYVLWVEHRPLASIGLRRPTWRTAITGIGTAAVAIGGMAAIYILVLPALHLVATDEAQLHTVTALPKWFQILICARAGVFEELLYRGFAIERLTEITRRRWLAAGISLAAFTYAHLQFWGWTHLIVAAFGGIVLTALYLWRKDLVSNMIAHFLTDAIGLLLV